MRAVCHLAASLSISPFLSLECCFSSFWQCSDSIFVFCFCLSQVGAVLHIEPVALWDPSAALPAATLIRYHREGVWSYQVHNIVQLQPGVWRRVDEDIRQSVPLVCHPIESSWRKSQMFHPRSYQGVEFLPLRAPEQGQPLLVDPLCRTARAPLGPAWAPTPLPAQPPCPLHALPPEQRMVWGVGGGGDGLWGGGVTVNTSPGQEGLPGFSGVLVILDCDGNLGLWHTNITTYSDTHTHKPLISFLAQ